MSSNYSKSSLRRVSFSPDIQLENPIINRKRSSPPVQSAGMFTFRLPKTSSSNYYSPARNIFRRIGAKVVRVVRFVAMRRKQSSSRKVSSSSSGSCSSTLTRSRSVADHALDSHRAEAIEDCIEFLNSNSSSNYNYLQRSNSVSSSISNY